MFSVRHSMFNMYYETPSFLIRLIICYFISGAMQYDFFIKLILQNYADNLMESVS